MTIWEDYADQFDDAWDDTEVIHQLKQLAEQGDEAAQALLEDLFG